MKNALKSGILALACAAAAASVAVAQPAPPTPEEQAARSADLRQSLFKLAGFNMGPMGGMLRGNVPFDAAVVETNASNLAALGEMIPALFMADTREFDVETEALDTIWTNKDDFNAKAQSFVDAAAAAATAAATGDEGATKQALGALGQTCGACHDDYRVD